MDPSAAVKRAKGRLANQIRPLTCERGLLNSADGSARWAQDGSAVLAAVHGPVAAGPRREDPERAVVNVALQPRVGAAGPHEHEMAEVLKQAVEGALLAALHPRTAVTVAVQVLQADGALLACAANAACAALADAGVPLKTLFAAASAVITEAGDLLIDPDAAEEASARASFDFAFPYRHALLQQGGGGGGASGDGNGSAATASASVGGPGGQQQQELVVEDGVLMCHATGRFSAEELARALEACRRGCGGVARFCRVSLVASFQDALVTTSTKG